MKLVAEDDATRVYSHTNELVSANTYLIFSKTNRETYLYDPGSDIDYLESSIPTLGVPIPAKIILTHGHFDHVIGAPRMASRWGCEIFMHGADRQHLLRNNFYMKSMKYPGTCQQFEFEDLRQLAELDGIIQVIHTPGHSPGSCIFIHESFAVTGDTLLPYSILSKTVTGAKTEEHYNSVKSAWGRVSKSNLVLPGHGNQVPISRLLDQNVPLANLLGTENARSAEGNLE